MNAAAFEAALAPRPKVYVASALPDPYRKARFGWVRTEFREVPSVCGEAGIVFVVFDVRNPPRDWAKYINDFSVGTCIFFDEALATKPPRSFTTHKRAFVKHQIHKVLHKSGKLHTTQEQVADEVHYLSKAIQNVVTTTLAGEKSKGAQG
jgi:hypothetical protein